MVAAWPEPETLAHWIDEDAEHAVGLLCSVVGAVRSTRARYNIAPKQELDVTVKAEPAIVDVLEQLRPQITSMARVSSLEIGADAAKPAESAAAVVEGAEVYTRLSGLVDFAAERARLEKDRKKTAGDVAKLEKKLSNPGFLSKAAPEIVEKDKAKLAELSDKLERLDVQLAEIG